MSHASIATDPAKDDLAERARAAGAAVLPFLVALYGALGLLYLVLPPIRPGWQYVATSLAAAALTASLYRPLSRAPVRLVHAWLLATVAIGVAYALGFVALTGDPAQSVVPMIALIGAGCLLFDVRAQVALAFATAIAWLFMARDFEPSAFAHWSTNLASSALLSVLVVWSRLRVLSRLELERLHAIEARRLVSEQARELEAQARKLEAARVDAIASVRAKNQFLANMSHEMRTPLTSVIGASDLLLGSRLDAQQREYAQMVRRAGEILARRIGDVLDFADLGAGRTAATSAEFDLRAVLDDVVSANRRAARDKSLTLRVLIDQDVPRRVRSDGERVRRVLENLLSNAIRFTERGTVALSAVVSESSVSRATVRFEVRDTGEGMSADELEVVFDAFSQVDGSMTRSRGGLGLGLALSKAMVELMGGTIGARSEPGSGSVFWFQLPLELVAVGLGEEVVPSAVVLVVEDDEINQQVIAAMVAHLGYRPEVAPSGARALELLEGGGYAAVLMDCMMPGMDGYETTSAIRARERSGERLPIIALTANAQRGARRRSLAAGMDDHLTKPVEQHVLARVLGRWVNRDASGDGGGAVAGANGAAAAERAGSPGAGARSGSGSHDVDAPLDHAVLNKLAALGRGKQPDLLAGLVDLFVERAPAKVAAIRDALTAGALDSASAAAHSLKSSSAMVGAAGLASLCSEMEKRTSGGEIAGVDQLLARLDNEVNRVVEALRTL